MTQEHPVMPWDGITLASGAPGMQLRDLLRAGGLDWDVRKVPAVRRLRSGQVVTWPGHFEIRREDTEQPLGHVLSDYEPCQNRDAFAFGDVIVASGQGSWAAACQTYDYVNVITVLKFTEPFEAAGETHLLYMILSTSHNGSSGVRATTVPFREATMCQAGVTEESWRVSVRHIASSGERLEEAASAVTHARQAADHYASSAAELRSRVIVAEKAERILGRVMGDSAVASRHASEILGMFSQSESWPGTGLGLLSAFTEHQSRQVMYRTGQARYASIRKLTAASGKLAADMLRRLRKLFSRCEPRSTLDVPKTNGTQSKKAVQRSSTG